MIQHYLGLQLKTWEMMSIKYQSVQKRCPSEHLWQNKVDNGTTTKTQLSLQLQRDMGKIQHTAQNTSNWTNTSQPSYKHSNCKCTVSAATGTVARSLKRRKGVGSRTSVQRDSFYCLKMPTKLMFHSGSSRKECLGFYCILFPISFFGDIQILDTASCLASQGCICELCYCESQ